MKLVHSLESVVRRKKSTRYPLPTTHYKVNHGFTLIELLIAITIIAILIGLGTYTWINAQEKGRDGKRKSEMKEVQKALEIYAYINGIFPTSDNGQIKCNTTDTTTRPWGQEFKCDNTTFMQKLPSDPLGTNEYVYKEITDGTKVIGYTIYSTLENSRDPDRCTSGIQCLSKHGVNCNTNWISTTYTFCVTNP